MSTDSKKNVGQRLQLLRIGKNMTQEQMGEKLNLSTSAYCKIEYGETDLTLTRLNKIAEVLQMSPAELFNIIEGNNISNNGQTTGSINDNVTVQINSINDLRDLIRSNTRLIDILIHRIDFLEKKTLDESVK